LIAREIEFFHDPPRRAAVLGHGQEQMLHGDIVVLQALGLLLGLGQGAVEPARDVDLVGGPRWPGHLRQARQLILDAPRHLCRIDAGLGQDGRGQAALLPQQGGQQVLNVDLLMVIARRDRLRGGDGFLRFLGHAVDVHFIPSFDHGLLNYP